MIRQSISILVIVAFQTLWAARATGQLSTTSAAGREERRHAGRFSDPDYRSTAQAQRGAIFGTGVTSVNERTGQTTGQIVPRGALISSLQPGSPADRYGLPLGGVIVSFGGHMIERPQDLIEQLKQARPRAAIEVGFFWDNTFFRKVVHVAPMPDYTSPAGDGLIGAPPPPPPTELTQKQTNAAAAIRRPFYSRIQELQTRIAELEHRLAELERTMVADKNP